MNAANNPYDVCAWRPVAECEGCSLVGRLKCRFDRGDLLHFVGTFGVFVISAAIGVIHSGYGWYLVGWLAFCLVFFEVWEIRILCVFHINRLVYPRAPTVVCARQTAAPYPGRSPHRR